MRARDQILGGSAVQRQSVQASTTTDVDMVSNYCLDTLKEAHPDLQIAILGGCHNALKLVWQGFQVTLF
jgi:hypothetical protein